MRGGEVIHVIATNPLAAAVVGTLVMLALIGVAIYQNVQSKAEFARQLTAQSVQLARQVEESQRLFARLINSGIALDRMNGELEHSLESAQTGWRALIYEHAAVSKVQEVAQRQAGEARWLEGVAEATTALAHEVNNPLTALLVNVEFLEAGDKDQALEIAEIQVAALRIAAVIKRLVSVANARSVAYLGESRMLDLSPEQPS
jgi:signal transduction histidine kinase